jgi:hypothetical protein
MSESVTDVDTEGSTQMIFTISVIFFEAIGQDTTLE